MLTFSAVQFAGLTAGFALPDLPLSVPKWYLFIKNGIWALASLLAAAGLFFGRKWAPSFTRWGIVLITIWYWVDRLILVQSDFAKKSWPMAVTLILAIVLSLFWVLNRRSLRYFYLEDNP